MRIKDWLMSMETLAEEAKDLNLEEPEAIEYMLTNLHVQGLPALEDVLKEIYQKKVRKK
jgi:hypothetical protein|tara:strand:+ start:3230 stop:3406 length:177 start_codon:yes stop_codon:yes gene_type:complete